MVHESDEPGPNVHSEIRSSAKSRPPSSAMRYLWLHDLRRQAVNSTTSSTGLLLWERCHI